MDQSIKSVAFQGMQFQVSGFPGDSYFDNLEAHVGHNHLFTHVLRRCLDARFTMFDVGANVGVTTVLANKLFKGAQTISIEPSRVFTCLQKTASLNGLQGFRAFNCCAGASDGATPFVDATDSSASHRADDGTGLPNVAMRSLDSISAELGLSQCDLIKIDVEGFELSVLEGMQAINRTYKPLVYMEFNSFTLTTYGNVSPRAVLDKIISQYGEFLAYDEISGTFVRHRSAADVIRFLAINMTQHGCVDDILFSASPERYARLLA